VIFAISAFAILAYGYMRVRWWWWRCKIAGFTFRITTHLRTIAFAITLGSIIDMIFCDSRKCRHGDLCWPKKVTALAILRRPSRIRGVHEGHGLVLGIDEKAIRDSDEHFLCEL